MKKLTFILCIFFINSFINAQSFLGVEAGYGGYLLNSENDLHLLADHKMTDYYFGGLTYQFPINSDYSLSADYNFTSRTIEGLYENEFWDDNMTYLRTVNTDYTLLHHSYDFVLKSLDDSKKVSYGFGPTFVITNRILGEGTDWYDKLASSGIGVCATLELVEPLQIDSDNLTYNIQAKLRYTHSVWFDKGIRKLDGYKQEFVMLQLSFKWLYILN